MYTIENEYLKISCQTKGAELQRVFHKKHKLEYLWEGDPAYWGKKSPVLFPMVGTLKEDMYFYKDQAYTLSRHGFARDLDFEIEKILPSEVTLLLKDSDTTRKMYPFAFEFRIKYTLVANELVVTYQVFNPSADSIYFSVGGHPAFRVPLAEGTQYSDYYLVFNNEEEVLRWPISPQGLIEKTPQSFMKNGNKLPLSHELFSRDALVFKHLTSNVVSLHSHKTERGLHFQFTGFPFLGIWAAKGADFVCIEPWCGIADSVDSNQQWVEKEGIVSLQPLAFFEKSWSVILF